MCRSVMVKFKFKLPDYAKAFELHRDELVKIAAATVQTQRAMIFDSEGRYNGRSGWKPLKFRQGMILSKTGALRRSVAPRNDGKNPARDRGTILEFQGSKIVIGTSLIYAGLQNFGGVVKAKNAKALKIPTEKRMPGGKRIGGKWYIFRKSVTVPARPFLDWTSQDQSELNVTLQNKVREIWNAAS